MFFLVFQLVLGYIFLGGNITFPTSEKNKKHSIEIIIDRIALKADSRSRIAEGIEMAIEESEGLVKVLFNDEEKIFSTRYACAHCGFSLPEIHPRIFSFNAPQGACPVCHGLGETLKVDPALILDPERSIDDDGIHVIMDVESSKWYHAIFSGLAKKFQFSLSIPIKDLPEKIQHILLYGSGSEEIEMKVEGKNSSYTGKKPFEGLVPMLERRYAQTESEGAKNYYEQFMVSETCPACKGKRLREEVLSVKIEGQSIVDLTEKNMKALLDFFKNLKLNAIQSKIADKLLKEIFARLQFLLDVGLDYLNLSRKAETLSGGEMQKSASLRRHQAHRVLYVLDEPPSAYTSGIMTASFKPDSASGFSNTLGWWSMMSRLSAPPTSL